MGGGTRSFEFARRLVAGGHSVDIVSADPGSKRRLGWRVEELSGIRVHWVSVPYSNNLGFFGRIRAFFEFSVLASMRSRVIDYDLVFATSTPLTIALPGMFAARIRRVPMVFEVRDLWPEVPIALGILRNPLLKLAGRWLERTAYRSSAGVVALAPGMRDEVIRVGGLNPSKVIVIPNGCDSEIFGVDLRKERAELRGAIPWLGDRPLVVFAGALGKANGVVYLAEIAVKMRAIAPEVRFVVIGDGAERAALEAKAESEGVLGVSLFILPFMPKQDVAVWLAASDFTAALFSGPPILYRDAVQNKFFDSLAAGRPVMCNFHGFQSSVAVESDVGIIVPGDDPLSAAEMLLSRLEDRHWLSGVPERCQRLVDTRFSRDLLAFKFERFLLTSSVSTDGRE